MKRHLLLSFLLKERDTSALNELCSGTHFENSTSFFLLGGKKTLHLLLHCTKKKKKKAAVEFVPQYK